MSTAPATTPRPSPTAAPRPAAGGTPPLGGGVAIDPIRLLKKYYPLLIAATLLGAALGAAAHFVLARVSPRYTSFARFEVQAPTVDFKTINPTFMAQDELLRYMGTQISTITSSTILEPVSRDPKVEETEWAKQFVASGVYNPVKAQEELEKKVNASMVPQSTLIQVAFTWKRPEDARAIVDAVTRIYLARLRAQQSTSGVLRKDVLTSQIQTLDDLIKTANTQRDKLIQEKNIGNIQGGGAEVVKAGQLAQEVVRVTGSIEQLKSQLANYQSKFDQPVREYPDAVRELARKSVAVQSIESQISEAKVNIEQLRLQGYGPEHPTVITARKRLEALETQRGAEFAVELDKAFAVQIEQLKSGIDAYAAEHKKYDEQLTELQNREQDVARARLKIAEYERDIASKTIEKNNLEEARKNAEIISGASVYERVSLRVEAQLPTTMSFPKLSMLVPVGAILLMCLTAGVVLLREVLDQRVRGPSDLTMLSRLRVLGMLPDAAEDPGRPANLATAFKDAPRSVMSESFRLIRSPIAKAMDQHGHKSLLVLGGVPGSGATSVVCNLALACAGTEEKVLIVDANMRRPAINRVFNLPEAPGLGDCLAGTAKLDECIRPTSTPNLFVLTAGSSSGRSVPERLGSGSMGRLLAEASEKFDRIIIDSAPAIVAGDGMSLANRVNAVVLVVRAMNEKRGLVNRVRNQLGEARSEFLGVIVNAVRASAGGYFRGNIKATHEYQDAQS